MSTVVRLEKMFINYNVVVFSGVGSNDSNGRYGVTRATIHCESQTWSHPPQLKNVFCIYDDVVQTTGS
jgi:hypothetical protein